MVGTYVTSSAHKTSKPVRQIFVAIVCGIACDDYRYVVVRFQTSADHHYQFSGKFHSINANRLVSPYNCILQHSPKFTVCGIPGIRHNLGWSATCGEELFEIGDMFSYKKSFSKDMCICVLVGMVMESNSWRLILVVDPIPTDQALWKNRIGLIISRTMCTNIQNGTSKQFSFKKLPHKTQQLADEVIQHTRDVVGLHCDQGGILTAELSSVIANRHKEITGMKLDNEESTFFIDEPVFPMSTTQSRIVENFPGRFFSDMKRYISPTMLHSYLLTSHAFVMSLSYM